jgi:hypothetical protein
VGLEFGLRSVLMEHGYNRDYNDIHIPRVQNWHGFYQLATGVDQNNG